MNELEAYCVKDTLALEQILTKFGEEIFDDHEVDIVKCPTVTALGFKIFRTSHLEENKIPKILGDMYKSLKQSFYGGFCEFFKAFGKMINSFDFISLYPAMMEFDMPVGKPVYFKGDPFEIRKNPFGFFKVKKVIAPYMKIPILPKRHNTGKGDRTILPYGTWEGGYIFSEEIKNAIKHGYKFEIDEGFFFERGKNLFTSYV